MPDSQEFSHVFTGYCLSWTSQRRIWGHNGSLFQCFFLDTSWHQETCERMASWEICWLSCLIRTTLSSPVLYLIKWHQSSTPRGEWWLPRRKGAAASCQSDFRVLQKLTHEPCSHGAWIGFDIRIWRPKCKCQHSHEDLWKIHDTCGCQITAGVW